MIEAYDIYTDTILDKMYEAVDNDKITREKMIGMDLEEMEDWLSEN
jgi:hypothetical protein